MIPLKELCSHLKIIAERLRLRAPFGKKINKDEPRLISVYMYLSSAYTATE